MLQPRVAGVPVPTPTPESAMYWEGTRVGELRFQRCDTCSWANFGPGLACARCQRGELRWERSAGLGRVYSWTVVWRPQTPAFEVPYAPAIIRMDEGYDMLSAVVGVEADGIVADQRVCAEFHAISEHITLPFFGPVAAAGPP